MRNHSGLSVVHFSNCTVIVNSKDYSDVSFFELLVRPFLVLSSSAYSNTFSHLKET